MEIAVCKKMEHTHTLCYMFFIGENLRIHITPLASPYIFLPIFTVCLQLNFYRYVRSHLLGYINIAAEQKLLLFLFPEHPSPPCQKIGSNHLRFVSWYLCLQSCRRRWNRFRSRPGLLLQASRARLAGPVNQEQRDCPWYEMIWPCTVYIFGLFFQTDGHWACKPH